MAPVIRIATVADAETIAAIHVAAWKETYTGLVPDSLIAAQSVGDRTERWRHILVSGAWDETTTFLVRTSTGQAVGFGSCGRQRTIDLHALGFDGEIYAIYLLQSAQGQGVGRRLLAAMARSLTSRGLRGGSLWVLRSNTSARRFYEATGGHVIGEHQESSGEHFNDVAYGWRDLGVLLR